jgi:plasmid stabilization system protein ParE
MKLRLMPEALSRIEAARDWWRENRDKAPDLFDDELTAALGRIRDAPLAGQRVPVRQGKPVRRTLLPKTGLHVYYDLRGDEVVVLTVWGAARGDEPRFG